MNELVVIFGGTKGIGRATAEAFLKRGRNVAVLSRNENNVKRALEKLHEVRNQTNTRGQISGFTCDVQSESRINEVLHKIEENEGKINTLIYAAGIALNRLLVKTSLHDMESTVNTNLIGAALTNKAAVRYMMKRKSGSIVNIGSLVGSTGNAGQCMYAATKAGLVGFSKSLAKEVSSFGIRINVVAPGFTDTEMITGIKLEPIKQMIPLQRIATPEEIAESIYFIANSRYITGEVLLVDGGFHLNR